MELLAAISLWCSDSDALSSLFQLPVLTGVLLQGRAAFSTIYLQHSVGVCSSLYIITPHTSALWLLTCPVLAVGALPGLAGLVTPGFSPQLLLSPPAQYFCCFWHQKVSSGLIFNYLACSQHFLKHLQDIYCRLYLNTSQLPGALGKSLLLWCHRPELGHLWTWICVHICLFMGWQICILIIYWSVNPPSIMLSIKKKTDFTLTLILVQHKLFITLPSFQTIVFVPPYSNHSDSLTYTLARNKLTEHNICAVLFVFSLTASKWHI